MYVNHATFLSNKINIRCILIFQNGKYFCHKFLPRNKVHEQGGKHDKTQNKTGGLFTETSRQLT